MKKLSGKLVRLGEIAALCVLVLQCQTTTRTEYEAVQETAISLEQPTPPGIVEPPETQTPVRPYRPAGVTDGSSDIERAEQADIAARERFQSRYAAVGNPKLALYINRSLSDDVREWSSDVRVTARYGESTSITKDGSTSTSTTSGAVSGSVETTTDSGAGRARPETWMWRLEDSVTASLLRAGAVVLDRATILRLAASERGVTNHGDVPVKQIEMEALRGKADVLLEITISREPDTNYGYIFRTRSINIATGAILASTSSTTWILPAPQEISQGQDGPVALELPQPDAVGSMLARDIMSSLGTSL